MPWTQKQMLRDANGDLIPQYWDVVEQEFKPLTGNDGANDVRLTGNIDVLLHREIESQQTYNLFIGSNVTTAAASVDGLDVSNYRGLFLFVRNNTERSVTIHNMYQGAAKRAAVSPNRIKWIYALGIEISPGSTFFADFRDKNEEISDLISMLNVSAPYFAFSLMAVGDGPMSEGYFDVSVVGIK